MEARRTTLYRKPLKMKHLPVIEEDRLCTYYYESTFRIIWYHDRWSSYQVQGPPRTVPPRSYSV